MSNFQLSKLQAANRAASVSYEEELELTTTEVKTILFLENCFELKINQVLIFFFSVGTGYRMGTRCQIVRF